MIRLLSIEVENFYSVGSIKYSFTNGITQILGVNKDKISVEDNTFSSNGAGKTTIFNAISQCLFNKSIRGNIPIGDTYNTITKKPYRITVEFTQNDIHYKIINNRALNNIFIEEGGIDITPKGIKNQLQKIADILGVDYEVFNILTYLNQKNILAITNIASTDNIVYRFFSLDRLAVLRRKNRNTLRSLRKELAETISHKTAIENALRSNEQFDSTNISTIYDRIAEINIIVEELKTSKVSKEVIALHKELEKYTQQLEELKTENTQLGTKLHLVETQYEKLQTGVCPVCNSVVADTSILRLKEEKNKVVRDKYVIKTKLEKITEESNDIVKAIEVRKKNIKDTLTTFTAEIDMINKKILVLEEKNRNYAKFRKTKDALTKEVVNLIQKEEMLGVKLDFVIALDEVIKAGTITRSYVDTFTAIFNSKLKEVSYVLDMDLTILAVVTDGKVEFTVKDKAGDICYSALSSGEQTRVALLILITTLLVLEIIAGISVNFIVFDELLSVLDKDGIEMFKALLNTLKLNKNVFIVIHHEEITTDFFDRVFTVSKAGGISSLQIDIKENYSE